MAEFEIIGVNDAEIAVRHAASGCIYAFPFIQEYGRKVLSEDYALLQDVIRGDDDPEDFAKQAYAFALTVPRGSLNG